MEERSPRFKNFALAILSIDAPFFAAIILILIAIAVEGFPASVLNDATVTLHEQCPHLDLNPGDIVADPLNEKPYQILELIEDGPCDWTIFLRDAENQKLSLNYHAFARWAPASVVE